MKPIVSFFIMVLALGVSSCAETTARDELGRLVDTQTQATIAAAQLNSVKAEATTRAEATLQFLAIQGQQTRIAQQAIEMQTTQAQNARATQTMFAQRAAATQVAYNEQATATRQASNATATAYSADATSTRQAQSTTQTSIAAQYTQTANMQIVVDNQTRVAASATTTADAANAQNTRAAATATTQSISATVAVVSANVAVAQTKAEWEKRLEAARSVTVFGGLAAFLIGVCVVVVWVVLKLANAVELRTRTQYDANGVPFIVLPSGKDGHQTLLLPSRSPGAAVMVTPPDEKPFQIEAGAVDAETTKRAQAVELMLAATSGPSGTQTELLDDLTESPRVQILPEPPEHLLPPATRERIDAEWKLLNDEPTK